MARTIVQSENVVQLRVVREQRAVSVEEAWARFVAASEKAKATLSLDDGIAAGHAFADFVQMFDRKVS